MTCRDGQWRLMTQWSFHRCLPPPKLQILSRGESSYHFVSDLLRSQLLPSIRAPVAHYRCCVVVVATDCTDRMSTKARWDVAVEHKAPEEVDMPVYEDDSMVDDDGKPRRVGKELSISPLHAHALHVRCATIVLQRVCVCFEAGFAVAEFA